ncbi:glutathione S-transferase B-like [Symsagittifera roscoffensis]|uniref:glutathione S-transferase B-like n=1 Tax=Symsagittifera roscoffensis TaxID=84072 RepID=UPI00307B67EB
MTYQLGYWNIRGFIEPIHLVMEYLGLPYETKRYEYDAMNEWFEEDKPKLGADFPNIPYLKNGDFVLCQSVAILKYLGRKGGLYPALESPEEMAQLEALIDTVLDVRMGFAFLCYGDGFETKKIDFMDRVPKKLGKNYLFFQLAA